MLGLAPASGNAKLQLGERDERSDVPRTALESHGGTNFANDL